MHKIIFGGIVFSEVIMFNSRPFEVFFVGFLCLMTVHILLGVIGGKNSPGTRLMEKNFRWMPFPTSFGGYLANREIEKMKEMGNTAKPHDHTTQSVSHLSKNI